MKSSVKDTISKFRNKPSIGKGSADLILQVSLVASSIVLGSIAIHQHLLIAVITSITLVVFVGTRFRAFNKMLKLRYIKSIIGPPVICINNTVRLYFTAYDRH